MRLYYTDRVVYILGGAHIDEGNTGKLWAPGMPNIMGCPEFYVTGSNLLWVRYAYRQQDVHGVRIEMNGVACHCKAVQPSVMDSVENVYAAMHQCNQIICDQYKISH